jgi:hypothetical protein
MSARTSRRRPFRPALEALEARALLSAPYSFTTFTPPDIGGTVHLNDSGVAAGWYSVEFWVFRF